jgi:DNA replication protein DnaC
MPSAPGESLHQNITPGDAPLNKRHPGMTQNLLILDEMGYVTVDLPGAELLFQVLASRHETSSTIVTSNLMFSEGIKIFHEPILTAALLDRITHRALVMNRNGTSFRQR